MSEDIEDDGFITIFPARKIGYVKMAKERLNYFDEFYEYKGYALVNELYEDDDVRKNSYSWGQCVDGYIIEPRELEGLSSRSYAGWDEVWAKFVAEVENILK